MKIAIATFASLPNPPVNGGAVETLIDDLCKLNEYENRLTMDVFSVNDCDAVEAAKEYKNTKFIFYQKHSNRRLSKKNIVRWLFGKSIPDKTMSELIRMINRNEYDYVIITSINYEMEHIFSQIHSKVIWYLHGDPLSVLRAEAIKKITNKCHAVFAVSDFVNSRVSSVGSNCKVITVRNCTDILPVMQENEISVKQKTREKIGVSNDDYLFVYIGRITAIKGIYELVKAFVKANMPKTKLLIVGAPSGESEKQYFEKVKDIANQNVLYWGYTEHSCLNKLYCAADCIVAPSICQEAALLIALEASVCNRPLIATNIGGIPEYVDDKTTLVNYDDSFIDNLAEALKTNRNRNENRTLKSKSKQNSVEAYYEDFYNALQQLSEEHYKCQG